MEKVFNVAGPCFPDEHYMLPALDRMPGLPRFVAQRLYFVMHAPRQSGKTTALLALTDAVNAEGSMRAVYFTVESAQQFPDPNQGIPKIVEAMRTSLLRHPLFGDLVRDPSSPIPALLPPSPGLDVKAFLAILAERSDRPLAVFFDEVDCLSDGTLITFLRELRDGYVTRRLAPFPASVALVGMRDIRDYKARVRPDSTTLGSASPFNIITKDISFGTFSRENIAALYAQHTAATGQVFADGVADKVWELTRGQPWLVNAIARHCVDEIHGYRYGEPVTVTDVLAAKEAIIRKRGTHVDSLMERLKEERVRRVVEPVILGSDTFMSGMDDDFRYVLDLGLLTENERHALAPANPMYGEIMLRYLSEAKQKMFRNRYDEPFWLKADGSLDMAALMAEFQRFWRENSGADRDIYGFRESVPHLVLMAFLQRVVNGGGRIAREMATGSGRLDLCVEFGAFRYAVEVKTSKNFAGEKSYGQLAKYLDTLGLAEGWMPVFDEDPARPWDEKIFTCDETCNGKTIHVVGL